MQNEPRAHHFVPQLLLRGFASRQKGAGRKRQYFAWHYLKEVEPHEPNIKGIGQVRDFHGPPSDSQLEEQIAMLEGRFGSLVHELRTCRVLTAEQLPALLQFVAHLMIRTRNLREGTAAIGPVMIDGIEKLLGNAENRLTLLARLRPGIQERLAEDPVFRFAAGALGVPDDALMEFAMSKLSEAPIETFISVAAGQMRAVTDFPGIARGAQLKALASEESILARTEQLGALKWTLYEYAPQSLILGDAVVLARKRDTPFDLPLLVQPDYFEVAVPIAHDLLVVGGASDSVQPDLEAINETSAAISREWFVASRRTPIEEDLQRRVLGTRCAYLRDGDVRALMDHTFNT